MALDRNHLEVLSRSECLRLLDSQRVGRIGITRRALPMILPVNYLLVGDHIVFATVTGSKSLAVAHEDVVAFEVDRIEQADRSGWSVLVVGVARYVHAGELLWDKGMTDGLDSWVAPYVTQLVRLSTDRVTGRRMVGAAPAMLD